MLRIVDGLVFEGKPAADRFHVSFIDLGHGHREASVSRAIDWSESHRLGVDSIEARVLRGEMDDPDAEHKREANRKRAARRAKANVRRRCKALGLDTLLTLTYRENQCDKALCESHLKMFLEKVRANYRRCEVGEFVYVACFEQQKRGAWHVHIATQRLPAVLLARGGVKVKSWAVLRAMWRAVVGVDNGNIDVGRKRAQKSAAKCAAYISKYVLKMFEAGEDHSKRFRWSKGGEISQRVVLEYQRSDMRTCLVDVMQWCAEGGRKMVTTWVQKWGDVCFVAAEHGSGGG